MVTLVISLVVLLPILPVFLLQDVCGMVIGHQMVYLTTHLYNRRVSLLAS